MSAAVATVDHLVLAVPDLEAAAARIAGSWGCRVLAGGRHPAWGSWNAVLPMTGGAYLEVIAPHPEPPPAGARVFGLDEVQRESLATWAVRPGTGGLAAASAAAAREGVELGRLLPGSRRLPDGSLLEWTLSDPFAPRLDGTVPFLIDWGRTPHPSSTGPAEVELLALRIGHPDPGPVGRILAAWGLEASVEVRKDRLPGLRATLRTPVGEVELGR